MDNRENQNNKRIAKNTIYLYIRMFLTMAIGLYTSRVVLKVLGVSDFGLYNVIGGILTMFTMFSSALTIGTQRFLSFALGERNNRILERTFSLSLYLHILFSLGIFIIAETIGLWFLDTQMNIPHGREFAAFWVYQFTIFGFILNLVQIPFQSSLIAHERMNMYAYMSIYDVIMKLLIVFFLQCLNLDKLILYAVLIFLIQSSSILIYNFYCRHYFSECKFRIKWDKSLAKEMAIYSGWNLIGGSQAFFTNEGLNILLNIFCGTIVNAARGLSMNVNTYILQFVNNFQMAANPQIFKLYAAKEYDQLYRLVVNNCRIAEYLYLLIAIPAFIEIDYILKIWLGHYPTYTPIFVQIVLIQSALSPINAPVGMVVQASGRMKWPSIFTLGLLMIFPISYFVLKAGYSPVYVFAISAIMWSYLNIFQIIFANKYVGLPYKCIFKEAYLNTFIGGVIMFIVPYIVSTKLEDNFSRFFIVIMTSFFTSIIVIYFWGLTPAMKKIIFKKIKIRVFRKY